MRYSIFVILLLVGCNRQPDNPLPPTPPPAPAPTPVIPDNVVPRPVPDVNIDTAGAYWRGYASACWVSDIFATDMLKVKPFVQPKVPVTPSGPIPVPGGTGQSAITWPPAPAAPSCPPGGDCSSCKPSSKSSGYTVPARGRGLFGRR